MKGYLPHARGDLDARVGWTSDIQMCCGYWLGFLVDSLHRVITTVRLVPVNQAERDQLLPALDHMMHLWMPGARLDKSSRPIWHSLEESVGFTRQWQASVDRIRDQLSLATITRLLGPYSVDQN